jgi:hypothetical protein
MRVVNKVTLAAALLGASFLLPTFAQAHDWDRDGDHWRRDHHHYVHEHPVFVRERPVVVERERPVFVAPPAYYSPPAPSGLNLNFNIPLN